MIIYIRDNELNIINKNKLIKSNFKSISDGYIISKELFSNEFLNILKKNKIKNKLFGDKIEVIKNVYYTPSDLFMIEVIFNDLGFTKVEFINIREVLDNNLYVEINKNYLVFYFKEGIYLSLKYFKDIPLLFNYFKNELTRPLILFGTNKNIKEIKWAGGDVYYIDSLDNYMIDRLLKFRK